MKIIRPEKKIIIALLIKRTVLFFFGLCILAIFLYSIGTYQGFMDRTQIVLLRLGVILGIILGLTAFYGIILNLWFIFQGKFRYIRGIGSYIILGFFGILVAALGTFILAITKGNLA